MQLTTIILYIISYIFFFEFNRKSAKNGSQRLTDNNGNFTSKPKQLINSHLVGIITLGIVPVIIYKESILNLFIDFQKTAINQLLFYVLTFIVILLIAFKQSKKASLLKLKSELHLSTPFFISYFLTRALFLFTYELWLRGGLLFETATIIGRPLAIALNVFLYVLLHLFNSKKELLACIPFGIITCLFCFLFNAVWPAILLHISFSLAYEINFYRLNLIHLKNTKS